MVTLGWPDGAIREVPGGRARVLDWIMMKALIWLGVAGLVGCAAPSGPPPAQTTAAAAPATAARTATMGGSPPSVALLGQCDMATLPQDLLQSVNAARSSPQSCGQQTFGPAKPVAWHPALASAAGKHSADMARRNYLDHRSPDGTRVQQRVSREGYQARSVGENLAGGDFDPHSVVGGWLGSEAHCRNLMNPSFSEIGAACVRQPGSSWGTYWTMVLGNRAETNRPTPAPAPARALAPAKPKAAAKPPAKRPSACGAGSGRTCPKR